MKIKSVDLIVPFGDLKGGDLFTYNDVVYMKSESVMIKDDTTLTNAVSLNISKSDNIYLSSNVLVTLKAKYYVIV